MFHRLAVTQHANVIPHRLRQGVAQLMDATRRPGERILRALDPAGDDSPVGVAPLAAPLDEGGHGVTRNATKDGGVRDTVAAEAIGPMDASAVLARSEQSWRCGRAVDVELDTPHQVVGCRNHFDLATCQIKAAVLAAID